MNKTKGRWSKAVVLGMAVVLVAAAIATSLAGNVAMAADKDKKLGPRFVDNGDGTVTDNQTGLMWEQKTGIVGGPVLCSGPTSCADPTDVNNLYTWSSTGMAQNGTLFTDFLAKMNCTVLQSGGICGPGPHSDWRIPTFAELQTIVDCSFSPCIDPIFGPTAASIYWSSSSNAGGPAFAWFIFFGNGSTNADPKTSNFHVRAVRGGS